MTQFEPNYHSYRSTMHSNVLVPTAAQVVNFT